MNWDIISKSVQGFKHLQNNLICQDSIKTIHTDDYIISSIADGHGSLQCPFSDEGSKIAVEASCEIFKNILDTNINNSQEVIKHYLKIQIPKLIETEWKKRIANAHKEKNLDYIENDNIYIKYGTTLITVIITNSFIAAVQIGDGDLVYLDNSNNTNWIIKQEESIANVTDSICMDNAYTYFKTFYSNIDEIDFNPSLILLSTDGYYNSYINDEEFLKLATDYKNIISQNGHQDVSSNIEEWLSETSKHGSGDDISIVILNKNS